MTRVAAFGLLRHVRPFASSSTAKRPQKFDVTLDGETLYLPQDLAEKLGWTADQGVDGSSLTMHGLEPHYFVVAKTGSDSGPSPSPLHPFDARSDEEAETLARRTVESFKDPKVRQVLEHLKDR